jgi:hypothetical protein
MQHSFETKPIRKTQMKELPDRTLKLHNKKSSVNYNSRSFFYSKNAVLKQVFHRSL